MTVDQLKQRACEAVDKNREKIISIGKSILREPEMGYKEFKTSQKVKDVFDELGYPYVDQQAITGVIGTAAGKEHKAKIAIMGELDAVMVPNHPFADKTTNAAHACGHNVQIATMLGTAIALKESGVMGELDGDVALMAVPSEEGVELEYRSGLIKEGKIRFLGGKQEFIKLGLFDDIDAMVMQHTTSGDMVNAGGPGGMGFIAKLIRYIGKESHGAVPEQGINALTAARIGLGAVDAIRDTFRDEDGIRWHPIITKGGDLVNVVPGEVKIESFVRGYSMEAIKDANFKINRALKAGADAVGGEIEINDMPGYTFFHEDLELKKIVEDNFIQLVGKDRVGVGKAYTTDANDVSYLIPTVHAYAGGAVGVGHGADYAVENEELAYIVARKMLVMTVIDLLYDGAKKAIEIKKNFKPVYTKEEYLREWGGLDL